MRACTRAVVTVAVCVALLLMSAAHLRADFVHNFDLNGDYTKYLHSVENAKVWDERPHRLDVRYWAPTSTDVPGVIVYKYEFPQPIETASLFANQIIYSGEIFLDVSSNGNDYVTVASGQVHPNNTPPYSLPVYDLTPILQGSNTGYVRARMTGAQWASNIFSSQFLRTADGIPNFLAPYVYQFQAAIVPEPSTCMSLVVGLVIGGHSLCRRRRTR